MYTKEKVVQGDLYNIDFFIGGHKTWSDGLIFIFLSLSGVYWILLRNI